MCAMRKAVDVFTKQESGGTIINIASVGGMRTVWPEKSPLRSAWEAFQSIKLSAADFTPASFETSVSIFEAQFAQPRPVYALGAHGGHDVPGEALGRGRLR